MPYKDPEKARERGRRYRKEHPERDREYYWRHRERSLAQSKEYQKLNADSVRERQRRWRAERADYVKASKKAWTAANAEKNRQYKRKWAAANRDKIRAKEARWVAANPERAREKNRLAAARRRARMMDACSPGVTPEQWKAICEPFSDGETVYCAYCGVAPATAADHVLAIANGGKDEPGNVVPVCKPCNSSKGAKTWLWQWAGRGIRTKDCLRRAR